MGNTSVHLNTPKAIDSWRTEGHAGNLAMNSEIRNNYLKFRVKKKENFVRNFSFYSRAQRGSQRGGYGRQKWRKP